MSQGNVPISLLLDGGSMMEANNSGADIHEASQTPPLQPLPNPENYQARPITSLISQFQAYVGTPLGSAGLTPVPLKLPTPAEVIVIDDDNDAPSRAAKGTTRNSGNARVQDHVKNFQAQFHYESAPLSQIPLPFSLVQGPQKPTLPVPSLTSNRASINSLINVEQPSPATEKKRRATTKVDVPNKKPKTEPAKKKPEAKPEPKKVVKGKKKTPEVIMPTEKPSIHPTMTTDRAKTSPLVNLASPKFIEETENSKDKNTKDANEKDTKDMKEKDTKDAKEKEVKEKAERPVIALDIPLLDPKHPQPGQAEVVINVLKLAEEKYGWNVIHPNAKSAIDLMDEMLDDEDDDNDDEDDDLQVVEDKPKEKEKEKEKEKLTEEQLVKQHETRMIRKVGKYDYEDPFIDDAELQWEEEITTTKEGFFVYWGPLVEDKTTTASKKGAGKKK